MSSYEQADGRAHRPGSFIKIGNRISLLPVAQYCGLAAGLSEAHGAGRAAAMSSAFHAREAGADDAREKLARLTPKELDTISGWRKPSDVTVSGHVLTYESAAKEQPVGLRVDGEYAASGEVLTCGTVDFYWHYDGVLYCADMKKSQWTTSGPDSLQLLAYAYALAKKHGSRAFVVGLWIIEDAEWRWSDKVYQMGGFDELDLWGRIAHAAANNNGEANFGDHCSNCYGRLHCPEYTAPAALADTVLSPAAVGGAIDDPEKLAILLEYCERVQGMIDKVKEHARECARRGVTVRRKGQVLKFIRYKGKESLNKARLFAAIPEATQFIERGDDYDQMRWVKEKAVK